MKDYHKINSIFKRDMATNKFIIGQYSTPEIEYLKDNVWEFTEKVDGTNVKIGWNGTHVTFGGRTKDAQMPLHLLQELMTMFTSEKFKEVFPDITPGASFCLYGEGYGFKIQKVGKHYNPTAHSFVLFDVYIGGFWLKQKDVQDVANKLGIQSVPVIGEGTIEDGINLVKSGLKSTWGDFEAEGIVLRPKTQMIARDGHRIITKLKGKDFR